MRNLVLIGVACLAIATVVAAQNSAVPAPGNSLLVEQVSLDDVGIVEGHISLINDVDNITFLVS